MTDRSSRGATPGVIQDAWQRALKDALDMEQPTDLDRDLWPRMRERLAAPPPSPSRWDWALLAATVMAALAFPRIMLGVLYHL